MGMELIRFDMSEYMEKHAVSRLIGAPPGYVGFDQGGLLTDAVGNTPYAVILLVDIDKAHHDMYNLLLQVMDYGKLTDSNGKTVDFRNVVLIMTSNAGAFDMSKPALGFNRNEREGEDKEAINRSFMPEFRNRLDAIIGFDHLTPEVIQNVVSKFIFKLESQLAERGVTITLTDTACRWLGEKGYDRSNGARPLARLIADKIKKQIADEVLFGKLAKGGEVSVDVRDGELEFTYKKSARAIAKDAEKDEDELV